MPSIGKNECRAVAFRLVFHLRAEHPKAHIRNSASESIVSQHPRDVRILDHYRLVFAAAPGRGLVSETRSGIGNTGMQPYQGKSTLPAIIRDPEFRTIGQFRHGRKTCRYFCRFEFIAQSAVLDFQSAQRSFEWLWILNDFATGQCCSGLDAKINAIDVVSRSVTVKPHVRYIHINRHEPAISGARDRGDVNPSGKAQRLAQDDFTDLGQQEYAVRDTELVVRHIEAAAATTFFHELRLMGRFTGLHVSPV